jgi:predicted anti-sigma-YlaC factor YlaD
MADSLTQHLTPDELELWAQGLLGTERAMHLADCSLCRAEAEALRKLHLTLVQLPLFAPAAGFADRVMLKVKIPKRSGEVETGR